MTNELKPIGALAPDDFTKHRIWQFTRGASGDETFVRPARRVPVGNLTGKIVASLVTLADGQRRWALIGNLDPANAKLAKHFVTLSIENAGTWFHLARYHDHDYTDRGPEQLAAFLGLTTGAVFPISYDVSKEVSGSLEVTVGTIVAEPTDKLTREEVIALAMP